MDTHHALTAGKNGEGEHNAGPALVAHAQTAAVARGGNTSSAIAALSGQCDALTEKADRDQALEMAVSTAREFSHATSAAVAWLHNDEMICLARSGESAPDLGESAPDLGARIDVSFGLSGECVRTRKLVRCDDASTDPRVHPGFYQALRLRTILALPLIHDSQVKGVLVVFSTELKAFGEAETAALHLSAALMVEILSGEPVAREKAPLAISAGDATVPVVLAAVATLDKDAEGAEVKPSLECRHCLFRNPIGTPFCGRCGVPLNSPMTVASGDKPKTTGGEMVTNSAEVLKDPVMDKHETEPSVACEEQVAQVSWEILSKEIIADFEGFGVSNPPISGVSRAPAALNPQSSEPQSPPPKPPLASNKSDYLGRRITQWFRRVAG